MIEQNLSMWLTVCKMSYDEIEKILPELTDPQNEQQYQLMKLDYWLENIRVALVNVKSTVTSLISSVWSMARNVIENIAENFNEWIENILRPDSYGYYNLLYKRHPLHITKSVLCYIPDKRKEMRKNVRHYRY